MTRLQKIIVLISGIVLGAIHTIILALPGNAPSIFRELSGVLIVIFHLAVMAGALFIARSREKYFPFLTALQIAWLTSMIAVVIAVLSLLLKPNADISIALTMLALFAVAVLIPSALMAFVLKKEKKCGRRERIDSLDDPNF